jgi:hypothetical protein
VESLKTTIAGISGDSLGLGPADGPQRPAADRHRLDGVAAAGRPGLRLKGPWPVLDIQRRGISPPPRPTAGPASADGVQLSAAPKTSADSATPPRPLTP